MKHADILIRCARNLFSFIQVDLIAPMVVQGVEVQAWSQGGEVRGIRSFSVAYGVDEANLSVYKEDEKYRKVQSEL